jgi:transcriptional repressor NrdR
VKCTGCGKDNDKVIDSRSARGGLAIRRRRECLDCGERFTTYEYIELKQMLVVKRDGQRVDYDRSKVIAGLIAACQKRPVSIETIENIASEVEHELAADFATEVDSMKIGELLMTKLSEIDKVAYVRFASVYRSFKDVDEFMKELRGLLDNEKGSSD